MNRDRQTLIDTLVGDLTPVRSAGQFGVIVALWFVASWAWVVASTLAVAPIRPGSLQQLVQHPHFGLESLAGLIAVGLVGWIAFAESVPGAARRVISVIAFTLTGIWLGSYAIGFFYPALEPSMLGKRPYCFVETLIYAVPPLLAGLWLAKRGYVLRRVRAGALFGLAAGLMPALFMQLACMYVPGHIIAFHVVPGLAVAIPGALAGLWLLRAPGQDRQAPD